MSSSHLNQNETIAEPAFFQDDEFRATGLENVKKACELLEASDWRIERINETSGDRIQSLNRKGIGKIFRLTVCV